MKTETIRCSQRLLNPLIHSPFAFTYEEDKAKAFKLLDVTVENSDVESPDRKQMRLLFATCNTFTSTNNICFDQKSNKEESINLQ